jgi:hypothetical protein
MVTLKEFYPCQQVPVPIWKEVSYTADDLMKMWRWIGSWVDQRVKSLDGQLCTSKAQQSGFHGRE